MRRRAPLAPEECEEKDDRTSPESWITRCGPLTWGNGAGKTALFNVITGHAPLGRGSIRLRGERIDASPPYAISARGVRPTFQNGGLFGGA